MDVSAEDDVDSACLEDLGQEPHLLVIEVRLRRIEAGVMEGDEPPGAVLGGRQVTLDPRPQLGVGPVDIRIGVEDCPVGIAVVEREVRHPRVGVAGRCDECFLIGRGPGEGRYKRPARRAERTIARLVPVEEIGKAVGIFLQVAVGDIMVARGGHEEGRTQERRPEERRCDRRCRRARTSRGIR